MAKFSSPSENTSMGKSVRRSKSPVTGTQPSSSHISAQAFREDEETRHDSFPAQRQYTRDGGERSFDFRLPGSSPYTTYAGTGLQYGIDLNASYSIPQASHSAPAYLQYDHMGVTLGTTRLTQFNTTGPGVSIHKGKLKRPSSPGLEDKEDIKRTYHHTDDPSQVYNRGNAEDQIAPFNGGNPSNSQHMKSDVEKAIEKAIRDNIPPGIPVHPLLSSVMKEIDAYGILKRAPTQKPKNDDIIRFPNGSGYYPFTPDMTKPMKHQNRRFFFKNMVVIAEETELAMKPHATVSTNYVPSRVGLVCTKTRPYIPYLLYDDGCLANPIYTRDDKGLDGLSESKKKEYLPVLNPGEQPRGGKFVQLYEVLQPMSAQSWVHGALKFIPYSSFCYCIGQVDRATASTLDALRVDMLVDVDQNEERMHPPNTNYDGDDSKPFKATCTINCPEKHRTNSVGAGFGSARARPSLDGRRLRSYDDIEEFKYQ